MTELREGRLRSAQRRASCGRLDLALAIDMIWVRSSTLGAAHGPPSPVYADALVGTALHGLRHVEVARAMERPEQVATVPAAARRHVTMSTGAGGGRPPARPVVARAPPAECSVEAVARDARRTSAASRAAPAARPRSRSTRGELVEVGHDERVPRSSTPMAWPKRWSGSASGSARARSRSSWPAR